MNDKLDEFVDDLDNMVSSYQRNDLKNKSKTDTGNKKQKKALANDPMDPSSYSDCPKWVFNFMFFIKELDYDI